MRFTRLADWLHWQEQLHPQAIELGLERVRQVAERLQLCDWSIPIITVAGTNGKGSSVAYLQHIYEAAGYRLGVYTSPHLLNYNERIRCGGQQVSDALLCQAFAAIDAARAEISLTYFEFGTLAAFWVFKQQPVDVLVLEVGLGGRLDAVNLLDADVALITPISLDHQDWLGDTREAIAIEKAGIMRAGGQAVSTEPQPPQSLLQVAADLSCAVSLAGRDFSYQCQADAWSWQGRTEHYAALPAPGLLGDTQYTNTAAVLQVVSLLQARLPVSVEAIRQGLASARVPGRFSVLCDQSDLEVIVDVAHNPASAAVLAANLADRACPGRTLAVFSLLKDKDLAAVIAAIRDQVDVWCLAGLPGPRGCSSAQLQAGLLAAGVTAEQIYVADDVPAAWQMAKRLALPGDRLCAFGSFLTVEMVLRHDLHLQQQLAG